ncbi:helix-turn-helix domain-containing protein [Streptosporangiaceae bacterium NEAU-GS5]|nr:helix-turn-helix domain-containing protein [Streptosporangiaceae bacterium NEAU-GS5]
MVDFDETHLRRLLGTLDERVGRPLTGMTELLGMLAEVVPCDAVSWSRLDVAGRRIVAGLGTQADDADPAMDEVFWRHYQEHPLCHGSGAALPVVSIGDMLTPRAWHQTGLYAEYFRPDGVEHEIVVKLTHAPGQTHVLLLDRGPGPDFDDRDHLVLRLLRPHLDAAVSRLTAPPTPRLTARQQEILALVGDGLTNRVIARRLGVSEHTVRKHLEHIFGRLGVSSRTAAAGAARTASGAVGPGVGQ